MAFPTKKNMISAKGIDDIPQDKIDNFLAGSKDEIIDSKPIKKETSTTNVNVNIAVNDVTSLIGRESVFEKNFVRQTYYVHKDLIKSIDKLAQKGPKGAKTKIINAALKAYIDSLS